MPTGGAFGYGTAFKLTPGGTFSKLHDFKAATDGDGPGGLTLGKDGNLYGTTYQGGAHGVGTLFKLMPAGAFTVLHHFGAVVREGTFPYAPPIEARDGSLYGPTTSGGSNGLGSVYKLTPNGTFTTLFSFGYDTDGNATQGDQPYAPLMQGIDGAFYGTCVSGGIFGSGTVFKLTAAGVAATVYHFDGTRGAHPHSAVMQGADGNLYGTAANGGSAGGGVAYKLTLKGIITVLRNFDSSAGAGQAKGYLPFAGLVQGSDGNFYGATSRGGVNQRGVLFQLTPAGSYTVQASFNTTNGAWPESTPLLHTNGRIYGLTNSGGGSSAGTLYGLDIGAPAFISAVPNAAKAGSSVGLLGAVGGTTAVSFNGVNANFSGTGSTYRTVVVPTGAATGLINVTTPTGASQTLKAFQQLPTLTGLNPGSGKIGSSVVLTGTGLSQTTKVTFGGGKVASFVVNTNTQITATVPVGATSGKITVTTKGGSASTATAFTVLP